MPIVETGVAATTNAAAGKVGTEIDDGRRALEPEGFVKRMKGDLKGSKCLRWLEGSGSGVNEKDVAVVDRSIVGELGRIEYAENGVVEIDDAKLEDPGEKIMDGVVELREESNPDSRPLSLICVDSGGEVRNDIISFFDGSCVMPSEKRPVMAGLISAEMSMESSF